MSHKPVVLCFSGHDPSGGAGIQADLEVIFSLQCHCCSVITALTNQDSANVRQIYPQTADHFFRQTQTLLDDIKVDVIKIGLIGDIEIAKIIVQLLAAHPSIPVVFDPVLASGAGTPLSTQALTTFYREEILPLTTLVTPNSLEARQLAGTHSLEECAHKLQKEYGVRNVLVTGTHEESLKVCNQLFMHDNQQESFYWERLPNHYHGSGCTLASAIAALLAQGLDLFAAVHEAQEFTWQSLAAGYRPGQGQHFPDRLFWINE